MVAPKQCNSPRANIGLIRLPASILPSPLPAPTNVCNSSMNNIISPLESLTALSIALNLSSNCPRNIAPAINAPKSNDNSFLFCKFSGISRDMMRSAKPSTIAVLPTPGFPIRTGLFLVRRDSTCIVRRISSSRPITGSNLPSAANLVKSVVYFSMAFAGVSCISSGFITTPFLSVLYIVRIFGIQGHKNKSPPHINI